MPVFTVMTRGKPPATVEACNWIVALGLGVEQLVGSPAIERLACEMLPNGTIIARDVASGAGFVVRPDPRAAAAVAQQAAELAEAAAPPDGGPPAEAEPQERSTVDSESFGAGAAGLVEPDEPPVEPPALGARREGLLDAETALVAWERALALAAEVCGAEAGAAVQLTSNDVLFFVAVLGGAQERLRAARLPHGTGFVGFCVDRVVGFVVEDAERDPRHYQTIDQQLDFRTRDALLMPVVHEGTLFGCLELLNAAPGRAFTEAQLPAVEAIAFTLGERLYRAGLRGRRL